MLLGAAIVLLQMSAAIPDAGRIQRDAKRAQARFETFRRSHLPWDRSGGSPGAGQCDAHIGRYCYWHDSTQSVVVPEPKLIAAGRNGLITLLDSSAALNPADGWIAGQRVRYLIEGGRTDDAVNAARQCRAEPWRCTALEGLALHVAQRYQEADSVFRVALRAMPEAERCEWLDLRRLTEGRLEREISRASCVEREVLAHRLWELSEPFWSEPGNDLRTEHFARHTMSAILTGSANAHAMSWGADSEELLVRLGWAEWFTRHRDDVGGFTTSPRVTGRDREPSYNFLAFVPSIRSVPRIADSSWRFRDQLARTRYAPRYLKRLVDLPHQLARFPRGDSMLVTVAYRIADTALSRDSVSTWLLTRRSADGSAQTADGRRETGDWKGRGVLSGLVARDTLVASIEVRGSQTKKAARARYTIDPLTCHGTWCLSDLLLFEASDPAKTAHVDSLIGTAAAELTFSSRKPLGVYWEIQTRGQAAVPVWLNLIVSPARVSLARRVATRLKLASELAPVRLRWQTTLTTNPEGQHVMLRLPHNARGGYRVLLTLEPPDAPSLTAIREIVLVP
jgi:hypothetical protein